MLKFNTEFATDIGSRFELVVRTMVVVFVCDDKVVAIRLSYMDVGGEAWGKVVYETELATEVTVFEERFGDRLIFASALTVTELSCGGFYGPGVAHGIADRGFERIDHIELDTVAVFEVEAKDRPYDGFVEAGFEDEAHMGGQTF